MKKRMISFLLTVTMAVVLLAGCQSGGAPEQAVPEQAGEEKDSVVIAMGPTSEPEAGFDPACGWGAGEHVHEPLIQSTLTVTNTDLTIGYDLATGYTVSEDGLTWTVTIRDDVSFTDGEPLTAGDVAFTYNTVKAASSVNDFTADVLVRRAINIGVDRQEMIDHVLNGYGTPAYSICDQMPWYNEASEVEYDPEGAAELLDEAGWTMGDDGVREKDGVKAELNLLYSTGDSVRQALAADFADQLGELGISCTIEGVGWDTAYDRALSEPLIWGWGAHTPMELYNIYHTEGDT